MIILLTGGSACGKSTYAEKLAVKSDGKKIYLAAMKPYGEEGEMRIARHRRMRAGKSFETVEKYTRLWETDIPEGSTVLLECLCNLTANEMFDEDGSGELAEKSVIDGIKHLSEKAERLIIVTNDVGSDGSGYDDSTQKYIDILGQINRKVAAMADVVIEMVCGIPIFIKGRLE